ncbi:MAG TPA: sensor histidine kinase [Streptosporangiaceae bacterium]|nr:sensor histidine kinase [Streptosporangiaceae bacterium]
MSRVDDWRVGWVQAGRRIAVARHAPAVAGGLLAVLATAEVLARSGPLHPAARPILLLLGLGSTLPLVVLWTQPSAAVAVGTVACALALRPFHMLTVAGLAAELAALYRAGRHSSAALAAVAAMPFLGLALARPGLGETRTETVLLAALAPVAAWCGIALRARSEAAEHSAAREVIVGSLLEHTARGERARISRELHDVVAHHISMIAVQAESARLTTPGMPAAGAQRLLGIGDTARTALTEMRRLLGVLREDTGAEVPDRQPQPGLRELTELLDEARDATGAGARLIVHGWLAPLDPGVELAAYRIVQEALTNARRHAPGAAVDVELRYTDEALLVRIRDNGPGPAPTSPRPPGGHGLTGMRERAAAVGGELRTGAAGGGGFLVEATLPAKAEVTG